jgi:tetratricopeptide (TPR) repeat protein
VAEAPDLQEAWVGLIRSLTVQGRRRRGAGPARRGAERSARCAGSSLGAGQLPRGLGDFEGAIALYEQLYEMLPNAPVLANNLASLISTYRDDEESLERAYTIARRLRGTDLAPFQDTYGWIAYRRGEYQDALEHLEPAAAAAEDPLVQYPSGHDLPGARPQDDGPRSAAPRAGHLAGRTIRGRNSTSRAPRSPPLEAERGK